MIAVKHIRVGVQVIGAGGRGSFLVDPDLPKVGSVAKRLSQRTVEVVREVGLSNHAVVERQTESVAVEWFHGDDAKSHYRHATAAGRSGRALPGAPLAPNWRVARPRGDGPTSQSDRALVWAGFR